MRNKNIIITGVAGLLGSRMAKWIIENHPEYHVIGIDNLRGGYIENVHPEVLFYHVDLEDDISHIFGNHKPEYVFHFAAYAAEGLSPFIRMFNYKNNLLATANVINNCITNDVKRLIFTSSMAVYGKGELPFAEDLQPMPIDPYGIAKFACEEDIKVAGVQHDLDWCIIRPHNVYGENQNIWDKYRNVIGIWMNQALNDKPMTIYGDGQQTRAFSYIDDCLEPFWKCATQENTSRQIINIGGTVSYSINEANMILQEITGHKKVQYLEGRHEVKHAYPTWEKSIKLVGYADNHGLKSGMKKMWEWAKQQPQRPVLPLSNYEIEKGIYSFWKL